MADELGSIDVSFIPGVFELLADFDAIAGDLGSFKDPLEEAVKKVAAPSVATNFDVGGRPPWEELNTDTLDRGHEGLTGQILIRSGALKDVASSPEIWSYDDESASVEGLPEEVYYGTFHLSGTHVMPERPFLTMQEDDLDKIAEVFDSWISERLVAHGFANG